MTAGTSVMHDATDLPGIEWFDGHTPFALGELEVTPFPVPHDAWIGVADQVDGLDWRQVG